MFPWIAPVVFAALAAPPTAPPAEVRDDTVEIVNLLVAERLQSRGEAPAGSYLVLVAETLVLCPPEVRDGDSNEGEDFSIGAMVERADPLPGVSREMVRSLRCAEAGMLPSARYENALVVLESRVAEIFGSGIGEGWEIFYASYPDSRGLIEFTPPVFSEDGRTALVYESHSCGGLCGTGWLIGLRREEGRWRVASEHMLWIS